MTSTTPPPSLPAPGICLEEYEYPYLRHSERNDRPVGNSGADQPLGLMQMWVAPDETGVDPGYEQRELDPPDIQGRLAVVASGMERHHDEAAIRIRNRCAGRPERQRSAEYQLNLQVIACGHDRCRPSAGRAGR